MTITPDNVTLLLRKWSDGDSGALEQLTPLVYDELHRLAHQHMRREKPGHLVVMCRIRLKEELGYDNLRSEPTLR